MTLHYQEPHQRNIDAMVQLAAKNLCNGVIEEPRNFYDIITLPATVNTIAEGTPGIFFNGEQFPIRLTHMSMAIRPNFAGSVGLDERFIQRVGVRLTFHDSFYMTRDFVPAPLWLNKVVAAADLVTQGSASLVFDRPNILSARDSLRIEMNLEQAPASPRRCAVGFTGVGAVSKRPYFLGGFADIANTNIVVLDPDGFRNDGAEPILLTDMCVNCGGERDAITAQGDIRQLSVNVRQIGNGTQADWFKGPQVPVPVARCPAVLLGYDTGRAIVHQFPGDGLIWEPGDGITVDMRALDASVASFPIGISLYGYISIANPPGH